MTIKLRVTRPMHADGRAHATGATLLQPPLQAGITLDGGRAELVNPEDREAITRARLADARHHQAQDRPRWPVGSINAGI